MRRDAWLCPVFALIFAMGLGVALAADPPDAPLAVTNYGQKSSVSFDHGKHAGVACVDCHHNEASGQYKCGECHKAEDEGKALKIKDAFHKKDSGACYSCHFGNEPKAKKLKCSDCHAK